VVRTNRFFERFGGLAVILARFVPVVRTFAPLAAGVGNMNYRKYSLYNLIGALLWGAGLTYGGYLLGYIPPLSDFVSHYIDIILLGAVFIAIVPTAVHYVQTSRKAKSAAAAGRARKSELLLDPEDFTQHPSPGYHGEVSDR
jgi:membrane-associated protein